ncbi:MAG: hypothetical protein NZ605_02620 [Acidimicrobiales bacterium]|nr:hypothetical protein [Acidimicrobiales bacterium]
MQVIRETRVVKRNGWKIGMALGLAGFLLCAGCSQQDSDTSTNAPSAKREVVDLAEAERLAVMEGVELAVAELRAREGGQVVEPEALVALAERARVRMESGVDDSKVNIRRSGNAERDGYDKARARAKALTDGQPDAESDRSRKGE